MRLYFNFETEHSLHKVEFIGIFYCASHLYQVPTRRDNFNLAKMKEFFVDLSGCSKFVTQFQTGFVSEKKGATFHTDMDCDGEAPPNIQLTTEEVTSSPAYLLHQMRSYTL